MKGSCAKTIAWYCKKQFWSRCSLEQSFIVNKTAEATKKGLSYLHCSSTWTGRKKIPAIHPPQMYMYLHTQTESPILNRDKGSHQPLQRCPAAVQNKQPERKPRTLYSGISALSFEVCWYLDLLSLNLNIFWSLPENEPMHSRQLCFGVIKPRERAAVAASYKLGWLCWAKRNTTSQSTSVGFASVLVWRAVEEI